MSRQSKDESGKVVSSIHRPPLPFVMCGCFGNMRTCSYCVLYCLYCVVVLFRLFIFFSYLFCLYWCKDYCYRVTTELQLVIIIIIIIRLCQSKIPITSIRNRTRQLPACRAASQLTAPPHAPGSLNMRY